MTSVHDAVTPGLRRGAAPQRPGIEEGQLLGDRYRVGALLGEGSHACVYEGVDEQRRRKVALKVLRPDANVERGTVEWEARAAAAVDSDHFPRVYGSGVCSNGLGYIVMERLRGEPLRSRLQRRRLHPRHALNIAHQVGCALHTLHASNLIHGDVHALNVFVERTGTVKLIDFGRARPKTGTGGDWWRTDVHALCSLLFESLTRTCTPKASGDAEEMLSLRELEALVAGEELELSLEKFQLRNYGVSVSAELERVVAEALSGRGPCPTALDFVRAARQDPLLG